MRISDWSSDVCSSDLTSGSRVMDDASAEGGSYECSTPPRPVDRLAAVRSLVGSTIRDVEMDLIRETLRVHGGKRIVAAGILGVSVRTLRNKVGRRSAIGRAHV